MLHQLFALVIVDRDFAIAKVLSQMNPLIQNVTSRFGKGHSYADVILSADARRELDEYIESERGREPGPLFLTRTGGRMLRQQIDRFLRSVANQANSKLPPEENIKLHTHMLRHTSTKRVYEKKGPVAATERFSSSNVTRHRRGKRERERGYS